MTWKGSTRSALKDQIVYPPIESGTLRTWVGVGGSPESVIRAARYGLPLTLAIIGGDPIRFRPYVDLYQEALEKFGKPPQPIAVHSPGHVAATDEAAKDELWPHYQAMMNRIGGERGWPPASRAHFEREAGPGGALCVGSPETVAAKIINTARVLGLSRFDLKYSSGTLPHEKMLASIELIGTTGRAARARRARLEHAEEREQQQDRGEDDRHVAQAAIEAAQRDLARVVLEAQAVQLHGELRVQLLHRDVPPGLPMRFGVAQDDVLEVADAAREVGAIGATIRPSAGDIDSA